MLWLTSDRSDFAQAAQLRVHVALVTEMYLAANLPYRVGDIVRPADTTARRPGHCVHGIAAATRADVGAAQVLPQAFMLVHVALSRSRALNLSLYDFLL